MHLPTSSGRAPGAACHGRPLRRVAMASALSAALSAALCGSAWAAPGTYRIIQLSPRAGWADINVWGQVGFTDYGPGGASRVKFYDGRTVRDIGTLGGPFASFTALNDFGQITGSAARDASGSYHAFRWGPLSGMLDLRPGPDNSTGNVINNRGWVAGNAAFTDGVERSQAFRWTPRTGMVPLGSFQQQPGGTSAAYAMNDAGTVVGWAETADSPFLQRAYRWTEAGGMQALAMRDGAASSSHDINESGLIAGSAAFSDRLVDQAFLWSPRSGLQPAGLVPGYQSYAERLNERGVMIGQIADSPLLYNGFAWSREYGMVRFRAGEQSTVAADVNNRNEVVGRVDTGAFIWTRARGVVDLNTLVRGVPPGFQLWLADAISDNGVIVARANTGLVLLVPGAAYRQAPVAGPVGMTGTASADALLSFTAAFRDVDVRETHSALWSWGDGSMGAGVVSASKGAGSVSGQHAYRARGIYTVRLTLTDSGGKHTAVERQVVVSGNGGAAAGQGAFLSSHAPTASVPRRGGVARIAFLLDADRSALHFSVGNLALRSSQVDSIALGAGQVRYSGSATVNGVPGYRFELRASSGAGTVRDRIHMRISHVDAASKARVVDYDNGGPGQDAAGAAARSLSTDKAPEGNALLGDGAIVIAP